MGETKIARALTRARCTARQTASPHLETLSAIAPRVPLRHAPPSRGGQAGSLGIVETGCNFLRDRHNEPPSMHVCVGTLPRSHVTLKHSACATFHFSALQVCPSMGLPSKMPSHRRSPALMPRMPSATTLQLPRLPVAKAMHVQHV